MLRHFSCRTRNLRRKEADKKKSEFTKESVKVKTPIAGDDSKVDEEATTPEAVTAAPVKPEAKKKLYSFTAPTDPVKTSGPTDGETEKQERLRKQKEKQVGIKFHFPNNTKFSPG